MNVVMVNFVIFSILILLMTVKVFPSDEVKENELCIWWKSVKLGDELEKDGDFVIKNGIKYSVNETFISDNKRRGCPCINNPCIRKCCKENQIYRYYTKKRNGKVECVENSFGINVSEEVTNNEIMNNFSTESAVFVHHDLQYSCYKNKMFSADEDYIVVPNGSLLYKKDNRLVTIDDYCFDYVQVSGLLKSNITNGTYFFMCDEPEDENGTDIQVHVSKSTLIQEKEILADYYKGLRLKYYPFFMVISLPFLTITFVIYTFVSELNNLVGKCVATMALSLAVTFNLMPVVMRQGPAELGKICKPLAYTINYVMLSSFFWLNVMCFDIWAVFSGFALPHRSLSKRHEIKKYLKYALYAWGSPLIICGIIYFLDETANLPLDSKFKPNMGNTTCLLSNNYPKDIFFYLPLTIILILNIAFFSITMYKILKHKSNWNFLKTHGNKVIRIEKERLDLYLKLFLVMGIPWIGDPLSHFFDNCHLFWFWFSVDAFNSLQGIPIFIIFVCKRRTWRILNSKLHPSIRYFSSVRTSRSSRKESNVDSPEVQESTAC